MYNIIINDTYFYQRFCSNIILTRALFLPNIISKQTTSMCYIYCLAFTQSQDQTLLKHKIKIYKIK